MAPLLARPRALVVPFSGQGHLNGFLPLARSLASQGFAISFVYFARAHQRERRATIDDPAIRIEVVPDGLPQDQQQLSVRNLLCDTIGTMKEGLVQLVEKLSKDENGITCIISDTLLPWTQEVADKFGIPRIDFWTSTATVYAMLLNLPQLISKGYLPVKGPFTWKREDYKLIDFIPGLPPFRMNEYHKEMLVEDLSDPVFQLAMSAASRARDAERILINSVYGLESSAFDALREEGIPVYSVGPLIQSALSNKNDTPAEAASSLPSEAECLRWLDTQTKSSVIYVAFGSYSFLSLEETQELALGLEASTQPFIWVIRSDSMKGDLSDLLPQGFLSRTKQRGLLMSWAPQLEVLAHSSVGGFLTHCGWNSTLESLWMGVPMIVCPRGAEQRSNARLIAEEWKVGLELERKEDGRFGREAVERAVRALMGGEEGEEARRRVGGVREVAREAVADGGLSRSNLQKFAHDVQSLGPE